jgi:hypothetical protein
MVMEKRGDQLDHRSEFRIAVGRADSLVIVAIRQECPIDQGAIMDADFEEVSERVPWKREVRLVDLPRPHDVLR